MDIEIKKKERSSNFELLRIICILFIIAHHYVVVGDAVNIDGGNINRYISNFLVVGGKLGSNCFVMISAYFLVNSKFKIQRITKILNQVFFYSVGFAIIFKIFNFYGFGECLGGIVWLQMFFPVISGLYWFATAYVGLYLVSPFLNSFIHSVSREKYKNLLIVLTIILSVLPTVTLMSTYYSDFIWFIYLYFLTGFIKKYPNKYTENRRFAGKLFVISYGIIFICSTGFTILGKKMYFNIGGNYFSHIDVLPMLSCSIGLFLIFKNWNIKSYKIINTIAGTVFGIYLIHDNILVREVIWQKWLKVQNYFEKPYFFIHVVASVLLIFIAGGLIDWIRKNTIERLCNHIQVLEHKFEQINKAINRE